MSKKWTREQLVTVATEMYLDGTSWSERYNRHLWKSRGWPEADSLTIYESLDAYIKYLRKMDQYEGNEVPEYKSEFGRKLRNK